MLAFGSLGRKLRMSKLDLTRLALTRCHLQADVVYDWQQRKAQVFAMQPLEGVISIFDEKFSIDWDWQKCASYHHQRFSGHGQLECERCQKYTQKTAFLDTLNTPGKLCYHPSSMAMQFTRCKSSRTRLLLSCDVHQGQNNGEVSQSL